MRTISLVAVALAALALAAPSGAGERKPTLRELEGELMCPICKTTLDQSNSPAADRIRSFIVRRIRAGDSEAQIKAKLEQQFGPAIHAAPPREGFDLLAWWLPIAGLIAGAAAVGALAWRWTRSREPEVAAAMTPANGRAPLPLELERRLDDELARFES